LFVVLDRFDFRIPILPCLNTHGCNKKRN
jgi:hypothetical protein